MIAYTVVRNVQKKKRNDSLHDNLEVEVIHHHSENISCDCCKNQMVEIGGAIICEEARQCFSSFL
ncbi:hypothetical protein [Niallia nealsonii]|uniref:Uncharacterized protein n=1 Tax=Niallia nealsonii TaxID=115979 RepID=A0A2N0Z1H3_9BACI|nr:hypothetical protein [Niallia nealsonii]PKG23356.1 hypothetical protein CWS01_12115 [Niallia nealsonii]